MVLVRNSSGNIGSCAWGNRSWCASMVPCLRETQGDMFHFANELSLYFTDTILVACSSPTSLPTGLDETMNAEELDSKIVETIPASLHHKIRTMNAVPNYDDFLEFDLLVLSPGIPSQHRLLSQAVAMNIPVTSELSFAAAMLPKAMSLVCVAGTSDNSTTTTFLAQALTNFVWNLLSGCHMGCEQCFTGSD
jgi:hypothetical protein